MIKVVSLLTIAMVFTALSIRIAKFHSQNRRGLMHETKIPVQELWLKQEGAYARGGCMGGILQHVTYLYYGYTKDQRHCQLSIQRIHSSNHQPWYNFPGSGSYTTAGKLYNRKVQGVCVHSTSQLYYSLIAVYLNCTREAGVETTR